VYLGSTNFLTRLLFRISAFYFSGSIFRFTLSKAEKAGRKENSSMAEYFDRVCTWFESEMVPVTTSELHAKMAELADSKDIYSMKHLKRKLEERYKDDIIISQAEGKPNLICFKDTAKFIIEKSRKDNEDACEGEVIIKTAAKLIKAEIANQKFNLDSYPSIYDIEHHETSLVPLLRLFMKGLISDELKQSSIGQTITKAIVTRLYIPPLLFGLGIELDLKFGSKWLTNELFKLGFSISPSEITLFKQSVMDNKDSNAEIVLKGSFAQWVADNVDHDVCTLDGKNTFHGMGIIAAGIVNSENIDKQQRIKRTRHGRRAEEIISKAKIPISWYDFPDTAALSKTCFKPIVKLQSAHMFSPNLGIDLFWQVSFISSPDENHTQWNGFMQLHQRNNSHPGKSEVFMAPIINLNPSDENCIYSTLLFIQRQATSMDIPTASVTFDQPLWLKAHEIASSKNLNIVVRLGGFHTLMSFLGSIGAVMEGSGLARLLELIYAGNSVTHIMSGKAVARALRAHFLVESALMSLLIDQISKDEFDITPLQTMYQDLIKEQLKIEDIDNSEVVIALTNVLKNLKLELSTASRTSKLWLQYADYIGVIRMFIRAERTGNWHEHLEAMRLMLNLYAATGHINYAKSTRLYLQSMQTLDSDHPWLYEQYCKSGFHCIRRTDRYWAGLWPDLVIEQCMMRAIKSSGGLTRGRGMAETTRNIWVGTLHECGAIHEIMSTLTKHRFESSEQHRESGETRRNRDNKDVKVLKEQLKEFNPFDIHEQKLQNIFTGLSADDKDGVNCDEAEKVGLEIQRSLDNIEVNKAIMQRSKQVKTLATLLPAVKVNGETIHADPNLLFQRLIMLVDRADDMTNCFEYELTPEPTSLFKDGLMRKPNKAQLGRELIKESEILRESNENTIYVLDGGALLHRVFWNLPATYTKIMEQYCTYISKKYGNHVHIVFDGYKSSIKDQEHQRRGKTSANIVFKPRNQVNCKQAEFLSNSNNKAQLIKALALRLRSKGHVVIECDGDADRPIVIKAIEIAREQEDVTVVADDTDILVMLVHMWDETLGNIFLRHEAKKSIKKDLEIINIKNVASNLPSYAKECLLFIHAWSGCDTTSALFGQGKTTVLKFLKSNSNFARELCSVFHDIFASHDQVSSIGIKVIKNMYGMYIKISKPLYSVI